MSDGDILQIQLWIGATAITALAVAMTAAKWEHKYFVWFMFGLSAALAAIALFWRQIAPILPSNGPELIGWLARTPYGWFALFTVGIVIIVAVARIRIALSNLDERFPEMEQKLNRVYEQRFINQTVIIDGKNFYECHFENVTFLYRATAPFLLTNCHFSGTVAMTTSNRVVNLGLGLHVRLFEQAKDKGIGYRLIPKDQHDEQFSIR